MKCLACGKELPENTSMTMHLECAKEQLRLFSGAFNKAKESITRRDE